MDGRSDGPQAREVTLLDAALADLTAMKMRPECGGRENTDGDSLLLRSSSLTLFTKSLSETLVEFLEGIVDSGFLAAIERGLEKVQAAFKQAAAYLDSLPPMDPAAVKAVEDELLAAKKIDQEAPVSPYEILFVEGGRRPGEARWLSNWLIGAAGEKIASFGGRRQLADAVWRLARARRSYRAIVRDAKKALAAGSSLDSVVADLDSSFSLFDFTTALEGAAQGDSDACRQAARMAKEIAPRLRIPRGRRMSEATRLVFQDPDFDPRPAWRRERAALLDKRDRRHDPRRLVGTE